MKIRVDELRDLIRTVLNEEAWVPGRWFPESGEPVDPDDVELMSSGGLGDEDDEVTSRHEGVIRTSARNLRHIIRQALLENPAGPGVAADPTDVKGFYPYDLERGADIHGYWYASPGDKGSSDPGRPEDAAAYLGFKTPDAEAGEETSDDSVPSAPGVPNLDVPESTDVDLAV